MLIVELRKTYDNKPLLKIRAKNFLLTNGFGMHLALKELRSLNTGLDIKFESFKQLKNLIDEINNFKVFNLSNISTEHLLNEIKRRINKWIIIKLKSFMDISSD